MEEGRYNDNQSLLCEGGGCGGGWDEMGRRWDMREKKEESVHELCLNDSERESSVLEVEYHLRSEEAEFR